MCRAVPVAVAIHSFCLDATHVTFYRCSTFTFALGAISPTLRYHVDLRFILVALIYYVLPSRLPVTVTVVRIYYVTVVLFTVDFVTDLVVDAVRFGCYVAVFVPTLRYADC